MSVESGVSCLLPFSSHVTLGSFLRASIFSFENEGEKNKASIAQAVVRVSGIVCKALLQCLAHDKFLVIVIAPSL